MLLFCLFPIPFACASLSSLLHASSVPSTASKLRSHSDGSLRSPEPEPEPEPDRFDICMDQRTEGDEPRAEATREQAEQQGAGSGSRGSPHARNEEAESEGRAGVGSDQRGATQRSAAQQATRQMAGSIPRSFNAPLPMNQRVHG